MPTGSQDKLAHCRGIRRMHLNSNMSACERAPVSQFGSSAHGSLLAQISVIRSVAVPIFLRYTPSKRSELLWVEKFMTSSVTWQKY